MSLTDVRQHLDSLRLPDGWSRCRAAEETALAAQLERELLPGHALHGRACTALARRGSCDDVLFYVDGDAPNLAVVRLTWHVPRDERAFPWVERFADAGAWAANLRR